MWLCTSSCRAHKGYLDARVSFARRKDQSYVQQVCLQDLLARAVCVQEQPAVAAVDRNECAQKPAL
jgi:hypothetical protein